MSMDTVIDIVITNPYSAAFPIWAAVSVILGLTIFTTGIVYGVINKDVDLALTSITIGTVVALALVLLSFAGISTSADIPARIDRVTIELEALGYDNIVMESEDISASDPDGQYVSGFYKEVTQELYTVVLR